MKQTAGIHHITAIVGHPQENVDFYAGVLGFRMVKKTINFDDPGTYHLYFGNDEGKPGTIITFFPWQDGRKGRIGDGQVGVTTYVVPVGALSFWENRLNAFDVPFKKTNRFDETYIAFSDPHGLQLEIVERERGEKNNWTVGKTTSDVAVIGFGGAVLYSAQPEKTTEMLIKVMGYEKIGEDAGLMRFRSSGDIGNIIDVKMSTEERGLTGVGVVHHIAFRAKDDKDHLEWQEHARHHGYDVTEVRDRNYFKAIYFQEDGGILFEIATDPPGFAHDESEETMGQALRLPEQYEQHREQLEATLTPIEIREID